MVINSPHQKHHTLPSTSSRRAPPSSAEVKSSRATSRDLAEATGGNHHVVLDRRVDEGMVRYGEMMVIYIYICLYYVYIYIYLYGYI